MHHTVTPSPVSSACEETTCQRYDEQRMMNKSSSALCTNLEYPFSSTCCKSLLPSPLCTLLPYTLSLVQSVGQSSELVHQKATLEGGGCPCNGPDCISSTCPYVLFSPSGISASQTSGTQ
ncbi:uncharacterized [Tachysurus ichikawai]